jgi:hypothetical protein
MGISVADREDQIVDTSVFKSDATYCATVDGHVHGTLSQSGDVGNLKTYLARPRAINQGTLATGTGRTLERSLVNRSSWSNVFGQQAFDRMEGAVGFRATMCFRLVSTATPFHQGIVALSWQYASVTVDSKNGSRSNFPALTTNLPHVKLDVAEQTAVELKVPFIAPFEYIPVDSTIGVGNLRYGTLAVTRLTDFRLGASQTAARYTLYAWLEDVELIGVAPIATTTVTLQAGLVDELRQTKLISKSLDVATNIVRSADGVPSLTPFSGPTAWFLRHLKGLASSFGFSRPVDETMVERVTHLGYAGESHVDMPIPAFKASPFQSNMVKLDRVGGTNEDHMALSYILSKPAMVFRKVWSSTAALGDYLYAGHVSPSVYWFRDNPTGSSGNRSIPTNATLTTSAFLPSHFMYIGSGFRYWRGSIRYTFQFSKTKMHGGRVVATFTPSLLQAQSAPLINGVVVPESGATNGVGMQGYTKMFDLRDSSTFDFDVPYISTEAYTLYGNSIGTVTLSVASPLNAPTAAADSIDMLVYVSAVGHFEFAAAAPTLVDGTDHRSDNTASGVFLQAGGVESVDNASERTMGELFKSVKQIAMMPSWSVWDVPNASTFSYSLPCWFRKDWLPVISGTTPIANNATAAWYGSPLGRMIEMFAYGYGSTLYTVLSDAPDRGGSTIDVNTVPNDPGATPVGLTNIYNRASSSPNSHSIHESRGALRVSIPNYARVPRMPILAANSGVSEPGLPGLITGLAGVFGNEHQTQLTVRNNTGSTVRYALGKSAGDDFILSQYIGPPVCNFFQSTSTVGPNPSVLPF